MARGRMLNTSISASKKMDEIASDTARLLATWTIAHLDLNGVFYADPAMVRSMVFPRRTDSLEAIEGYLQDMARVGLIVLFESGGEMWQYWPGFEHNQPGLRRERERSQYPMPPTCGQSADNLPPTCGQDVAEMSAEVKLTELNRNAPNGAVLEDLPFADSPESPQKRPDQLMWDALVDVCHIKRVQESTRGRLNKLIAWLRGDGYSADDVLRFGEWWNSNDWRKQNQSMTVSLLESKWGGWVDNGKPGAGATAPAPPPPKVLEGGAVMMPTATRRKEYER